MSIFTALLTLVAFLLLWAWGLYNKLVRLKSELKNSWSQIDVQLQRRYDLIPNLVESVKGSMQHERQTLEAVIAARNRALAAKQVAQENLSKESVQSLLSAENSLGSCLTHFFALAESYPQLKASSNIAALQEELASTENRIAFARQAYNDSALFYNRAQQEFPATLLAASFGHKEAEFYQSQEESRQTPPVRF
jgi:LemA protein